MAPANEYARDTQKQYDGGELRANRVTTPTQGWPEPQAMREMTPEEKVDAIFTYHTPDPGQQQSLETVRDAAKHLGLVILRNTPRGPDQTAALRKLREAVMTANASIVLCGVAGVAIDQAIPLGRVWSFPSKIEIAPNALVGSGVLTAESVHNACLALQLERVRDRLPLLLERDDELFKLLRPDPYELQREHIRYEMLQRYLEEAPSLVAGITGITVPQGE